MFNENSIFLHMSNTLLKVPDWSFLKDMRLPKISGINLLPVNHVSGDPIHNRYEVKVKELPHPFTRYSPMTSGIYTETDIKLKIIESMLMKGATTGFANQGPFRHDNHNLELYLSLIAGYWGEPTSFLRQHLLTSGTHDCFLDGIAELGYTVFDLNVTGDGKPMFTTKNGSDCRRLSLALGVTTSYNQRPPWRQTGLQNVTNDTSISIPCEGTDDPRYGQTISAFKLAIFFVTKDDPFGRDQIELMMPHLKCPVLIVDPLNPLSGDF